MENVQNDPRNLSDYSGSSCSSCCGDSDEEKPLWLDFVNTDGHLFYIEHDEDIDLFLEDALNNFFLSDEPWLHSQNKSKLKASEKLRKWMKERGKKVREAFPLLKSNKSEDCLRKSSINSPQFHTKDVFIDLDSKNLVVNPKYTLPEKLLGLKLGCINDGFEIHDKVIILGICDPIISDVKIGDWLKSINDVNVNMNNIEDIIKELKIPSKVKLNIISCSNHKNKKCNISPKHHNLIKELSGEPSSIEFAKSQYQHIPHILLLFSLKSGSFENDDEVFSYPDEKTSLYELKGMFYTLVNMIADVASPPLISCSVMVQNELIHVGFSKDEDDFLILGLPASVISSAEVQHLTSDLVKLFKYQFSSLKKAFMAENDEKNDVYNFLTLFFEHYLSSVHSIKSKFPESHLLDILPSSHWLVLPNDLKTEIDDILSELESSDFEIDSKGFYENRRIYNIFGSCLFYKGYLLSSHLPKDDLLDIHLFLLHNHLLELTRMQPVSQVIIWREVFPTRHNGCVYNDPEFIESHGRWFLLIVVMHHSILAVLLDDDGCSLKAEDCVTPESFYVEEVQNTLFILQDCGITAAAEKLLNLSCFNETSSDMHFEKDSSQNSLSSAHASNVSIHSGQNMRSSYSASHSSLPVNKEGATKLHRFSSMEKLDDAKRQQLLSSIGPADGESDSETGSSCSLNEGSSFENRSYSYSISTGSTSKSHGSAEYTQIDTDFENQFIQRSSSSLPNLNGIISSNFSLENSLSMVSGIGNNLFYYLHMDPVEGIFISPIISDSSPLQLIQKSILDSFYRCCLNMRAVFARSLRNGEILKANIKTKYGINGFLRNSYEQGVLFQYINTENKNPKENQNGLNFWVVGRLFFAPEPREIYVCYQDSMAQDIVELAFRLGFGLSF